MKYRSEIDGLRTVAVLPVILFHAAIPGFHGGFIGVDVFFVISGYLITTLLLEDLRAGRYSILTFYERRARRILPAYFAMLLVCLPFAWAWMTPSELADFTASAAAASAFLSNVWFWLQTGYFETSAELKPLLHTWSLAVEEQFYVVFPPLLWLLWRIGRGHVTRSFMLLAALSFALCLWLVEVKPDANFFLAPPRAWELLVGALCARARHRADTPAAPSLALAGLGMLLLGFVLIGDETPFPSAWTLLPVLGTALIIVYAKSNCVTGRLLSLRPMVMIGLLSYSAYLVHQPLFAFARLRWGLATEPPHALFAVLIVATFALAWLSWRYVERPFRGRNGLLPERGKLLVTSALLLAISIAAGMAGYLARGWPERYPQIAEMQASSELPERSGQCWFNRRVSNEAANACLSKPGSYIFFGDSHAAAMAPALRDQTAEVGLHQVTLTHNACFPIAGTVRAPAENAQHASCARFVAEAMAFITENPGVPVVIASRWALNLEGTRFDNGEGGHEEGAAVETLWDDGGSLEDHTVRKLQTLSQNHPLILIGPFPEAGWPVPLVVAQQMKRGIDSPVLDTSAQVFAQRNARSLAMLEGLESPQITFAPIHQLFCSEEDDGRCVNFSDGTSFYADDDHPSPPASGRIAGEVVPALRALFAAQG